MSENNKTYINADTDPQMTKIAADQLNAFEYGVDVFCLENGIEPSDFKKVATQAFQREWNPAVLWEWAGSVVAQAEQENNL